jgi:MFS family permease
MVTLVRRRTTERAPGTGGRRRRALSRRRRALSRRRNDRAVVAVLAFSGMTAAFMQTILTPLQAELPQLLHAPREDTAWVITVTLLVSATFTPISGRLGDMFGKRRIALCVLGLLVAGSVVAALSSSLILLIIGRGLQGVGMGVIPLGISILRDVMPPERLTSAVALVSATLGVGGALGLPVSALVSQYTDWHVLFMLASALGAVAFVLVLSSYRPAHCGQVDASTSSVPQGWPSGSPRCCCSSPAGTSGGGAPPSRSRSPPVPSWSSCSGGSTSGTRLNPWSTWSRAHVHASC